MSSLPTELRAFREMRRAHGKERGKKVDDRLDGLVAGAADRIETLEGLLTELVDIEGPCPGTGDWASKVRASLQTP